MTGLLSQSLLNLYTSWSANLDVSGQPRTAGARPADKTSRQTERVRSDTSAISPEALRQAGQPAQPSENDPGGTTPAGLSGQEEISPEEQSEIDNLKARDAEVHAHEQAHLSAAGNLARGGAKFDFKTGPDGKRYAVGGEVGIDTSPVDGDPQATLTKARHIQRAAMAPADPSPQDRSIAAEAATMAVRAQQELARQRTEGRAGTGSAYGGPKTAGSKALSTPRINIQI